MFNIGYFSGEEEFLIHVKPLWEQTRDFHKGLNDLWCIKSKGSNDEK